MFCTQCGKEIAEESKFCTSCGTKINNENQETNSKNEPPLVYNDLNSLTPAQEVVNKIGKQKKKCIGIAIAIFAVIIVFVLIFSASNPVKTVKDGTLNGYSEQTIGEAFSGFFSHPEWNSYKENGDTYVKFTGQCTLYGEMVNAKIIFILNGNDFRMDSCKLGDFTFTSTYDLVSIIDKIYYE